MPRANNHNERNATSPTWKDILDTMRYLQGAHKCFIQVQTGVETTGSHSGELYIDARAVDWNDGVGGKPIEVYHLGGWPRWYKTFNMAVYASLVRLEDQLDARWRWGDGEARPPARG